MTAMLTTVHSQMQPQLPHIPLTSVNVATPTQTEISARIARLKEVVRGKGKKAAIAKACKISRAAVSKWFKGGEIKAENLFPAADECEVEARWLLLGKGPKQSLSSDPYGREILELWERLEDGPRGELASLARVRAKPLNEKGFIRPKRA